MEALLIINSLLVGISMYFVKDFHSDFKELSRKFGKLSEKVIDLSRKLKGKK